MITEDYVSLETAKLLKEKGFTLPVKNYYSLYTEDVKYNFQKKYEAMKNWNAFAFAVSRPSQSLVMKWLREVHNIHISVYPFNRELPITENTSYTCDVATEKDSPMRGHLRGVWKTYEKAAEAAIKYALENLI